MQAGNAHAFSSLADLYQSGEGVPRDNEKANELWLIAVELGCAEAYYNLGNSYDYGRGVEVDKRKAKYYWEIAAINGDVHARHNLGCKEVDADNMHRAQKHFLLAAKAGLKPSLDNVKVGFTYGRVTKDEYANTLRAYQQRHDEMKSEERDKAKRDTRVMRFW